MCALRTTLKIIAGTFAYLSLALSASFLYRVSGQALGPGAFMLSTPKILAGTLAPFIAIMGAAGALLGLVVGMQRKPSVRVPLGTWLLVLAGITGAALSAGYVWQVTAEHKGFDEAFGPGWRNKIPADLASRVTSKALDIEAPSFTRAPVGTRCCVLDHSRQ